MSTYEEAAKELVENMKKYNVQGTSWISVNLSDFRYLYVTPIENMAALDSNGMAPLFEGMGQEAASAMFAKMNGCYDRHSDYILYLVNGLSYQPSGIDQTPEGQNYRKFFYLYTSPEKVGDLGEALQGVKKMFEEKESKVHYRVYRSGFGSPKDFFMVAVASADPVDDATKAKANQELMGDAAQAVFGKVLEHTTSWEEFSGYMRPDLAYSPSND